MCFARVWEIFTAVVSESQRGPHAVLQRLHAATHMCSVFAIQEIVYLDATVEHRYEKLKVKLIKKNIGRVFCQIFNRDVFDWFTCGN